MRRVKRSIPCTGILFFVILLVLAAAYIVLMSKGNWKFQETDRRLENPNRGFYIQVNSRNYERIPDIAKEVRIILLTFNIGEYLSEDLPEEKLEELENALRTAKDSHVAVVFRAAYDFDGNVEEPDSIERMGRHMEQISEILNTYADQILVVQAGMLGDYGEWHSSRYLDGTEEEQAESRLYILRQWEAYLSPQIKVDVRRPRFIREAMEEGVLTNRLGFHNDGLLSTDNDMGTYDEAGMSREYELEWMQLNLAGQVNGGEMPMAGEFSLPENADREFAKMHIGYLNLKYNEEVLARWEAETMGGMDAKSYLENHLGYRLFLSDLVMRQIHLEGELFQNGMKMNIRLCNTGYAPLPSDYKVFLAVGADGEWVFQEIQMPELYQISNGESVEKEIEVQIPEKFAYENTLDIGLKIARDAEEENGQDCVELANQEFVYQNGVNKFASLDREWKWFFKTGVSDSKIYE
ncbi:MAG: DUF4874 domain-containing protein [Lachnospiraceae bacterium]|nr:DUF4874 domain-containing protein [Lachnospiraceae bacterium]